MSEDLAAAAQGPFEPRCVARAFAQHPRRTFIFTMQVWINLDFIRSPLLLGNSLTTLEEIEAALLAFGYATPEDTTPKDALYLVEGMSEAIHEAFAMTIRMRPAEAATARDYGFGAWLPLLACLISEMGMSRAEALACPAGQAFALIAAMRCNQGWNETGTPYALRDATTVD